jgi:hypothetical protein
MIMLGGNLATEWADAGPYPFERDINSLALGVELGILNDPRGLEAQPFRHKLSITHPAVLGAQVRILYFPR